MATVGLDKLYYARITEDGSGNETYGTPKVLARAMQADLSVELAEATLYADDAAVEVIKAFKQGKITLGVDDLAAGAAEDLTGARIDENGVLVSTAEDNSVPVAIGFRARKANGKYRYFWLYRVVFAIPSASLQTKGDSITFSTPSIAAPRSSDCSAMRLRSRQVICRIGSYPAAMRVAATATGLVRMLAP